MTARDLTKSDAELVAECRKGEAWAWEEMVERYKRLVYTMSLRSGLSEEDAADVFQTVFERLLKHLHRLRDPQGLAAWLITTTKRESWVVSRRRKKELVAGVMTTDDGVAFSDRHDEGQDYEERVIDQTLVRDALDRIGEACKKLLWLLYFDPEKPSYEQIAAMLRMPIGSVGPTRARCLGKLRHQLRALGLSRWE